MKTLQSIPILFLPIIACAVILACAGCATNEGNGSREASGGEKAAIPARYKADDGRVIDIGRATRTGDGLQFKNPHLEKCWVVAGANFSDYDTLYIAPTLSTAKYQPDEKELHEASRVKLVNELARMLKEKRVFANVVTSESEIKPGARALKLENTITGYSKGGGAARYFVGLYGGGQPVLRVQGKMSDANKPVFSYEGRRSGVSAGARMTGVFMKDEDIQNEDIHSLAIDLTDFLAALAGKYQAKN